MALEQTGNYTLGRGKVWFADQPGDDIANGFRYVGNTPALGITVEAELLEHFNSDAGVRVVDASVPLQINRTGTMTLDDIQPENLALFFQGTAAARARAADMAAAALNRFDISGVQLGVQYQIGFGQSNPVGDTDIAEVTAGDDAYVAPQVAPRPVVALAGNAYAVNDDYVVNTHLGLISFVEGGAVSAGDDVRVYFARSAIAHTTAAPRTRIIPAGTTVRVGMKFIQDNPRGRNRIYTMPSVQLTANGELALKGEEWQAIPLNLGILKPPLAEAIIIENLPAGAVIP